MIILEKVLSQTILFRKPQSIVKRIGCVQKSTSTETIQHSLITSPFIKKFSMQSKECWSGQKKGFLLDVYGVAYNCGKTYTPIEGSKEAIDLLRKANIPFRFCSNTSTKTPDLVLKDIKSFNIDVKLEEIYTPIPVARSFIQEKNLRPFLLVESDLDEYLSCLNQSNPNCVLLADCKDRLSYENINKAFRILMEKPENMLITLGTGRYYQETEGIFMDCGPYALALEYATGKKAVCIGKPSKEYFSTALKSMGLSPSEAIMVGDDIVGDVEGAQKAGISGVLVRTGKYRSSDEPHERVKPDAYVDNLLDAVTQFLKARQS